MTIAKMQVNIAKKIINHLKTCSVLNYTQMLKVAGF